VNARAFAVRNRIAHDRIALRFCKVERIASHVLIIAQVHGLPHDANHSAADERNARPLPQ
jgi:hypothetical protein